METVGVNHMLAVGRIGKYGVTREPSTHGSDCARFLLVIPERGKDNKVYYTRLPVEIWGAQVEATTKLAAGQLVLVDGKLRRRKRPDDEWDWCLSSFEAVLVC